MASQLESANGDQSSVPVPERMWAWWQHNAAWREKLHRRAAHKALDIDEEPVIEANRQTINRGFGWPEMLVLAAAGLGGAYLFNKPDAQPTPPPAAAPVQTPAVPDSEYDVLFYDKDGNQIAVPRVPPGLVK